MTTKSEWKIMVPRSFLLCHLFTSSSYIDHTQTPRSLRPEGREGGPLAMFTDVLGDGPACPRRAGQ